MTIRKNRPGFTLAEMLVSLAILGLLIVFVGRLFSSATNVTAVGNKHIDCDLQAGQLFDRMAVDFAQMIKRSDVDCYVKGLDPESGNDKIAFFAQLPGFYPSSGPQGPVSLVAYRINAGTYKMERMGKGLPWNGTSTGKPLIFGSSPTLQTNWPSAADSSTADPDYEMIGSQIFRFEYFYFLNNGALSDTPGPTAGMQNVAAISACIAVIDPKSKVILSNSQISTLASRMKDYSPSMTKPGDLLAQWQSALDGTNDMPRSAISAIHLYQRTFSLLPKF